MSSSRIPPSSSPLSKDIQDRIYIVRSRLRQDARYLQTLLDRVICGEELDRVTTGELINYAGMIVRDGGELQGLQVGMDGPVKSDTSVSERAVELIEEIEGTVGPSNAASIPRDPPGRATPRERLKTGIGTVVPDGGTKGK